MTSNQTKDFSILHIRKQLFFSYFLFLSAITIIIGICIIMILSNNLASDTQKFLNRTSDYVKEVEEDCIHLALSAHTYASSQGLLTQLSTRRLAHLLSSLDNLQFLAENSPNIHSIFFYKHNSDVLVITGSQLRHTLRSNYPDTETLDYLLSEATHRRQPVCVSLLNSTYLEQRTTVFSIVYHLSGEDALVINLDAASFFSPFSSGISSQSDETYFIIDQEGNLLYSNESGNLYQSFYSESIRPRVNSTQKDFTMIRFIDGKLYHINYHQPSDSKWAVVSLVNWTAIYAPIFFIILLILILFAVGCFIIMLIFKPVANIVTYPYKQIQSELLEKNDDQTLPLSNLIDVIDGIKSDLNNHLQFKNYNLTQMQHMFLQEFLLKEPISDFEFFQKCEEYELPFYSKKPLLLLYLSFYHTDPASEAIPGELMKFIFHNVLGELYPCIKDSMVLSMPDGHYVLLASPTPDYNVLSLCEKLEKFHDFCQEKMALVIFCGIADSTDTPSQLPAIHAKLLEAFRNHQFFHPHASHELLPLDPAPAELSAGYYFTEITALKRAMHSGNIDSCQELLAPYFAQLERCSYAQAISSLLELTSQLLTIFTGLSSMYPAVSDCHTLFEKIMHVPTLEMAARLITEALQQCCSAITCNINTLQKQQFDRILCDLHASYTDENLSAKSLAAKYHITAATLNRMFNQQTGKSVIAYVKDLRLQKACELLESTDLPIETVAQKIGFENTKYFFTIFKSTFGTSPNRYRTTQKSKKSSDD